MSDFIFARFLASKVTLNTKKGLKFWHIKILLIERLKTQNRIFDISHRATYFTVKNIKKYIKKSKIKIPRLQVHHVEVNNSSQKSEQFEQKSETVATGNGIFQDRVAAEKARRLLPSDMSGTMTIAFSFINLSISFCLVNLNSAQVERFLTKKNLKNFKKKQILKNSKN